MKIHKVIIALLLFFSPIILLGQTLNIDLQATMLRSSGDLKKKSEVRFIGFHHHTKRVDGSIEEIYSLIDESGTQTPINSYPEEYFDFKKETIQQLWDANVITKVIPNIKKKGTQYGLRSEMEQDALDYIQKIKSYNLELDDPYLKTYIYSLITKIAPIQLIDGRPSNINIIIQENPKVNASCYPNGTIVLNTGLLSTLHTEDELVAILAHEIAHFVLDHPIQNVNTAIARKKRAEFWAGVATGLTALAEGYLAYKSEYYIPGAATIGMAALSSSIASEVVDRLGMEYNHDQEKEADRLAIQTLGILGYDKNALATALSRLEQEYINERNNAIYFNSYTHPALSARIKKAGTPNPDVNKEFEQIISFAVSSVAMMKYSDCRFRQCLPLVTQNIKNNVATTDDYLLKANCLLSTKNDTTNNQEIISLINKAKQIDSKNINIFKTEIIAMLRLNDKPKAMDLLKEYITTLESYSLNDIKSEKSWDELYKFIINEKDWAQKMIIKLKGMGS